MAVTALSKPTLILLIILLLVVVVVVVVVIVVAVILTRTAQTTTTTSPPFLVKVPKKMCIYYGYPSAVQSGTSNVTAAIATFSQFDLVIFGDNISYPTHGDHNNTQTIIGALNLKGILTYGYVDLGVATQNLTIPTMQTAVSNWAAMGIKGIFWDDAGNDFGVNRSRQTTMISYCHSLNLGVAMNAWEPDDVFLGSPMVLDSRDIYLLESFLYGNGLYRNITQWKIKADKCFNYAAMYKVAIACVTTAAFPVSPSFGTSQPFSEAWFGTAMYNFDYFGATDYYHSATNNTLYVFPYPIVSYGTYWKTATVQSDALTHYYRSSDTHLLEIFGDGNTYGSGNATLISSG